MSTPQDKQNQMNNYFGLSIYSIIFYCICLIIVVGIILTIVRYSMAEAALERGDYRSAAAIMSEGQPTRVYGHPYEPHGSYGPHHGYSSQKPYVQLNW